MKKPLMTVIWLLLAGINVITNAQSECCAWGTGGDETLRIVRRCCYMPVSITGSCCDGPVGMGYCQSFYYVNGEFLSSDFYYADGNTIRQAYCGFGS